FAPVRARTRAGGVVRCNVAVPVMVDRARSTDLGMLSPYQGYSRHLGGAPHWCGCPLVAVWLPSLVD
ncbi:MAG: hypothetical protein RJA72_1551, partial [Pseudomonadota bacterium]